MESEKSRFRHESLQDCHSIREFLEAIAKGIGKGRLEFTDDEGIVFLASGITSETAWNEQWPTHGQQDSVLVLTHDLINRQLDWSFINLEDI